MALPKGKEKGRRPKGSRGSVFVAVWPAEAITTQ